MTEHEYHRHLAKSADAFDREIDRYEAILSKIRETLKQQQEKVRLRRLKARKETRQHKIETLLKEADMIERVIKSVKKIIER